MFDTWKQVNHHQKIKSVPFKSEYYNILLSQKIELDFYGTTLISKFELWKFYLISHKPYNKQNNKSKH